MQSRRKHKGRMGTQSQGIEVKAPGEAQGESRMSSRLMTMTGVVLALVLLFAVNILVSRTLGSARIDLTENRLFTLSEGTRSILASYRGAGDPALPSLATRVGKGARHRQLRRSRARALLNEYERLSGGKLALHVIDPEPFSEEEDRAVAYGLRGVPLGTRRGKPLLRSCRYELRRRRGSHPLLHHRA